MATIELHNVEVQAFLAEIDKCEGNVFLVTDEGDRINLKSKLCQLIGLTQLIEGGKISNAHLECQKPEDESKLFRFNIFGTNADEVPAEEKKDKEETKDEDSKDEDKKEEDKKYE